MSEASDYLSPGGKERLIGLNISLFHQLSIILLSAAAGI
jgi:hypothetical protein